MSESHDKGPLRGSKSQFSFWNPEICLDQFEGSAKSQALALCQQHLSVLELSGCPEAPGLSDALKKRGASQLKRVP